MWRKGLVGLAAAALLSISVAPADAYHTRSKGARALTEEHMADRAPSARHSEDRMAAREPRSRHSGERVAIIRLPRARPSEERTAAIREPRSGRTQERLAEPARGGRSAAPTVGAATGAYRSPTLSQQGPRRVCIRNASGYVECH